MDFASRTSRKAILTGATILGAAFLPAITMAEVVTLKSADGTVNLVGEFIEFKDDNYVIRTELGDLRISAARVRCEGAACPEIDVTAADVRIAGSDTIALGMMPLLIAGFAAAMDAEAELTNTAVPGQTVAQIIGDDGFGDEIGSYLVTSSSTEAAFDALMNGEAKIGLASRRIMPAEARRLKSSGAGNMVNPSQERVVAVDSLVVITHPENPVSDLSVEDLRRIYRGEVSNWADVGGPDMQITRVARSDGDATRTFFDGRILGGSGATRVGDIAVAADDQEMAAMVNAEPGAIGYVGYAFQRGAKPLTLVNECGIAMVPDAFSAKTEEYALGRRLYLYNRGDAVDDATAEFLDFAISEEADGVVAKSGFIDLGIESRPQDMNGDRAMGLLTSAADDFEAGVMREMLAAMVTSDRLSTTFRFRTGSSNG
ncbi:MAG: PstS family phosphate ABC transporter substrate-binding protein [Pseudomonadota bacterium]